MPVKSLGLLAACLLCTSVLATPIEVRFRLLGMKTNYDVDADMAPLAGKSVRLVLGERADWQSATAGHRFTTDAKGEATFTVDATIDSRVRSRNVGFTPFAKPEKADHLRIAIELDHEFALADGSTPKPVRWLLTMDVYCYQDGQCSTDDFMSIHGADERGDFGRALQRVSGQEAWKAPELDGRIARGMHYRLGDFQLARDERDQNRRVLKLFLKRRPSPVPLS